MTTAHETSAHPDTDDITNEFDRRDFLRMAAGLGAAGAIIAVATVTKPWRFFLDNKPAQPQDGTGGGRGGGEAPPNTNEVELIKNTINRSPGLQNTLAGFMGVETLPPGKVISIPLKDPKGELPDQLAPNYQIIAGKKLLTMDTRPAAYANSFQTYEAYLNTPESGALRSVWGNPVSFGEDTKMYYDQSGASILGFTNVGTPGERQFQLFARGLEVNTIADPAARMEAWNSVTGALLRSGALG